MAVVKLVKKDGRTVPVRDTEDPDYSLPTAGWRLRFYMGRDPETGKKHVTTETFERKKDADAREADLRKQKAGGVVRSPSKEPVGEYLENYLDTVKKNQLRARTFEDYKGVLRRYVQDPPDGAPNIGRIQVKRLTPEHIQALYHHLQEVEGLSPRTTRSLHAVLRQGLAYANRTGAAARNVADLVELPKMEKRKVDAMTPEEAKRFLEAAKEDRYYALWCVLLTGGLRPGEALALQWDDVDLEEGRIHVQRSLTRRGVDGWKLVQPKTARGRRVVVLPPFTVRALHEHRVKQAEERLQLGAEYAGHGFVFATHFGEPLHGANLYARNFHRIMKAAELGEWEGEGRGRTFNPAYRLYDLRHTCATLLLRDGTNPKVVSERLGHASVAFTMDVYAASLPDLQEDAAAKMDARFGTA